MAKGGARPRSGPAPDPNALHRQRDGKEWTRLPTRREGETPEWPLEVPPPSMSERALWNRLWTMPQALVWEADRCHDLVALYVRVAIEALQERAQVPVRNQAKQLSTELLLTPQSLLSARYVIAGTDDDAAIQAAITRHPAGRAHAGRPRSARERFEVVANPGPVEPEDEESEDAGSEPE